MKEFAAASPNPKLRGGDEYAAWLLERVKVDTASFYAASFEIDVKRKLPGRKKFVPAQALRLMPQIKTFLPEFEDVFKTYHRKLCQLVMGERANSQV